MYTDDENNNRIIPVVITPSRLPVTKYEREFPVRKTIKRSNKAVEALKLPIFINLNARSIYNKKDEFTTLINDFLPHVTQLKI